MGEWERNGRARGDGKRGGHPRGTFRRFRGVYPGGYVEKYREEGVPWRGGEV